MKKKDRKRRVSVLLTPQTLYHLERLAAACGKNDIGWVIDKLTREKMLSMRDWREEAWRSAKTAR